MANFKKLCDELEEQVTQLGLITIKEAATLRGVSRSAILQLIQRKRLRVETVLGKQLVYRKEVEGFQNLKPGPTINTIYAYSKEVLI